MEESITASIVTGVVTFLITAFSMFASFHKKLVTSNKEIDAKHHSRIRDLRTELTGNFDLKYAPIAALTNIQIAIAEIKTNVEGVKEAIGRFETLLSGFKSKDKKIRASG